MNDETPAVEPLIDPQPKPPRKTARVLSPRKAWLYAEVDRLQAENLQLRKIIAAPLWRRLLGLAPEVPPMRLVPRRPARNAPPFVHPAGWRIGSNPPPTTARPEPPANPPPPPPRVPAQRVIVEVQHSPTIETQEGAP